MAIGRQNGNLNFGTPRRRATPRGQQGHSQIIEVPATPAVACRGRYCRTFRGHLIRPAVTIEGAAAVVYLGERSRHREEIMRGWTILLAILAIAGLAASASAQGKIRLAQNSVTTTCMMTCNSQYANCQSSCLATGTQAQSSVPGANASASQSCLSSCTNQQLQCQIVCARSPPPSQ
jgi:hypothetical protein